MDPYVSLGRGQYSSYDVQSAINQSRDPYADSGMMGSFQVYSSEPSPDYLPLNSQTQMGAFDNGAGARANPEFLPLGGNPYAASPLEDPRQYQSMASRAWQDHIMSQEVYPAFDQSGTVTPAQLASLQAGATDVQIEDKVLLHERVVGKEQQKVSKVVSGQKQVITIERVVEVPHVIVKETEKYVPKPEIIERIIEVPGRIEYNYGKDGADNGFGSGGYGGQGGQGGYGGYGGYGGGVPGMNLVGGGSAQAALDAMGDEEDGELAELGGLPPGIEPGSKEYFGYLYQLEEQGLLEIREEIVEVPQVVIEERIVHVPGKREIQERLIEVPRVEWVERVEYEDYIEYREVPVDKVIEVPEIEYKLKEVDYPIPQTYVQEFIVDKYKEVPVTEVQEVERIEHVPVMVPNGWKPPDMKAIGMPSPQSRPAPVASAPVSMPPVTVAPQGVPIFTAPQSQAGFQPSMGSTMPASMAQPVASMTSPYASYDPGRLGLGPASTFTSQAPTPPQSSGPPASTMIGSQQFPRQQFSSMAPANPFSTAGPEYDIVTVGPDGSIMKVSPYASGVQAF